MGKPKGRRQRGSVDKARIEMIIEDAIRNITLDASEEKRIDTLMEIGKTLKTLSDKTFVRAVVEEEGEERIAKARAIMDEAQEEFEACHFDNPGDAIEELWDSYGEYGQLCEALMQLELQEEDGEEE